MNLDFHLRKLFRFGFRKKQMCSDTLSHRSLISHMICTKNYFDQIQTSNYAWNSRFMNSFRIVCKMILIEFIYSTATKIWQNLPEIDLNYLAAQKKLKISSYFYGFLRIYELKRNALQKLFRPIVHGTKAFAANHDTSSHAWINEYLRRLFKDMLSDVCITKQVKTCLYRESNSCRAIWQPEFERQEIFECAAPPPPQFAARRARLAATAAMHAGFAVACIPSHAVPRPRRRLHDHYERNKSESVRKKFIRSCFFTRYLPRCEAPFYMKI